MPEPRHLCSPRARPSPQNQQRQNPISWGSSRILCPGQVPAQTPLAQEIPQPLLLTMYQPCHGR